MKHVLKCSLFFIASATSALTISSCKKESSRNDLAQNTTINSSTYARESEACVVLTDQEIDSIGRLHNVLLDQILTEFDYNLVPNGNMFDLVRTSFINTDYGGTSLEYKTKVFDSTLSWLSQGVITGNIEQYLSSIEAVIDSANNFAEISNYLSNIKSEVNNNSNLTNEEKQIIKIGISIALNSAEYWLPIEDGGDGRGYGHIVNLSIAQGNGVPTLGEARKSGAGIIAGDVFGGCAGGIGFCISVALGPVTTAGYVLALGFGAV